MAVSRGLDSGWLHGVNHQELVHARFGKKRGAFIGAITSIGRGYIEVKPQASLKPGDGLVIDRGGDTDREQGGRIYQILQLRDGAVRLNFEFGKLDFNVIKLGHHIWKTDDPQLNKELRKSWSGELAQAEARAGHHRDGTRRRAVADRGPLRGSHGHGRIADAAGGSAQKRPLTEETLRAQLGRLGETDMELGALENRLEGQVIVPVSELNRLRRELADKIARSSGKPPLQSGCRRRR